MVMIVGCVVVVVIPSLMLVQVEVLLDMEVDMVEKLAEDMVVTEVLAGMATTVVMAVMVEVLLVYMLVMADMGMALGLVDPCMAGLDMEATLLPAVMVVPQVMLEVRDMVAVVLVMVAKDMVEVEGMVAVVAVEDMIVVKGTGMADMGMEVLQMEGITLTGNEKSQNKYCY